MTKETGLQTFPKTVGDGASVHWLPLMSLML